MAVRQGEQWHENWLLAVVCDGLGGAAFGERAASAATAALIAEVAALPSRLPANEVLEIAISATHDRVHRLFGGKSATTLTAILVKSNGTSIGWVGDSRIYSLGTNQLHQLSTDDTLGAVLDASAKNLAATLSADFADRLSQAIGGEVAVKPHVIPWNFEAAKGCLLCTDGIWKPLEGTMEKIVANCGEDGGELARRLLLSSDWHGGGDNASGMLLPSIETVLQELKKSPPLPEQALQIFLPNARFICRPNDFDRQDSPRVSSGHRGDPVAQTLAFFGGGTEALPLDMPPSLKAGDGVAAMQVGEISAPRAPTEEMQTSAEKKATTHAEKKQRSTTGAKSRSGGARKKKNSGEPPQLRIIEEERTDETDAAPPGKIR